MPFVNGATANNWTAKGLLSIIDLSDMSVKQITKANGEELGFESKSTPLVSTHDGETYVYFTLNGAKGNWPNYTSGGGVYMYKLGDAEATEVFVPGSGYANYCMASVVCDEFGNLYYTNDSGHLFCVKSQAHRVKFDTQGGSNRLTTRLPLRVRRLPNLPTRRAKATPLPAGTPMQHARRHTISRPQ